MWPLFLYFYGAVIVAYYVHIHVRFVHSNETSQPIFLLLLLFQLNCCDVVERQRSNISLIIL